MKTIMSVVLAALAVSGCTPVVPVVVAGGQQVEIAVNPSTAQVTVGGTIQFVATMTGTADTSAYWSVVEAGGGSITVTGFYTAPATPGTYQVRAVASADSTKVVTALVTVVPVISITISPTSTTFDACNLSPHQFVATITGTTDTRVSWAVQESGGGTITSGGVYTVPASGTGQFHIVATSLADTSKTAVALVTVSERVLGVAVSPSTVTLQVGQTQQFTATIATSCGLKPATNQLMQMSVDGRLIPIEPIEQ